MRCICAARARRETACSGAHRCRGRRAPRADRGPRAAARARPQNSNLVVTSDVKRDTHEPTGEPETLAGRIKHKMGDRVLHTKPEGLTERKEKSK